MEIVKDKIMYQVATNRNFRVGDVLTFGKELNGQGKRALQESFKEYEFALREIAIETARKKINKDLPSRFTCMFLTDQKEYVLKGIKEFWKKGRGGKTFQAISVKVNGKLFVGNGYLNRLRQDSYDGYYNGALEYWKGIDLQQKPKKDEELCVEFLFEGTAEVLEIFDEYSVDGADNETK
ncbi:MAG: DUF2441 domain-containing protein [Christensenellaceae bacterium]|jgi:hypothetical protein|nr:DUF2441 domain-containing protein [Christensenellaceae bacterium]